MAQQQLNIKNKKASFEYQLLEKFDAGIQLTGTEIKSVRDGKVSLAEAYCYMHEGELFIKNMHISHYEAGGVYNHDPTRTRKLLLKKGELGKINKKLKTKGLTVVPVKMYIADSGFAKLIVALAKGKKLHDKRHDLKKKDAQRAIDRAKAMR